MPIRKPDGFPTYAVVHDSERRLVLRTRGSIYLPAFISFAFASFWLAPYVFGGKEVTALFVLSGLFFALGVGLLARWRRFVFDESAGTVAFDSLLFGRWTRPLSAIDDVVTDSVERQTTEKVGDTERTRWETVYRAFLVLGGRRVHLNENKSAGFIEDIRRRVLTMKARAAPPPAT